MKTTDILSWIARIAVVIIMLQTLFFKFTGAPTALYIFETIGMEPWGRIGSGIGELIAAVFLLLPRTKAMGAIFATGIISGAIFFHLTKLGIDVQGDGGLLFTRAIIVLVLSLLLLSLHWKELPLVNRRKNFSIT